MLTPLLAWTCTGAVFLIQPGYGDAYAPLSVRQYPMEAPLSVTPRPQWLEYRVLRSVLGQHLVARTAEGWEHLHAETLETFNLEDDAQRRELIADAITSNPERYGVLTGKEGERYLTSKGVEIELNAQNLSLRQYGGDTRWIDRLYQVHYLQWSGIKSLDKVIGVAALLLLALLSITGLRLVMASRR